MESQSKRARFNTASSNAGHYLVMTDIHFAWKEVVPRVHDPLRFVTTVLTRVNRAWHCFIEAWLRKCVEGDYADEQFACWARCSADLRRVGPVRKMELRDAEKWVVPYCKSGNLRHLLVLVKRTTNSSPATLFTLPNGRTIIEVMQVARITETYMAAIVLQHKYDPGQVVREGEPMDPKKFKIQFGVDGFSDACSTKAKHTNVHVIIEDSWFHRVARPPQIVMPLPWLDRLCAEDREMPSNASHLFI